MPTLVVICIPWFLRRHYQGLSVSNTLVTLPRFVTPYRDSADETRDRVTYQKLVTR